MKKLVVLIFLSVCAFQFNPVQAAEKFPFPMFRAIDNPEDTSVKIYTLDHCIVVEGEGIGLYTVTATDLLGAMIFNAKECSGKTTFNANKGIYIVVVNWSTGAATKRVVVK